MAEPWPLMDRHRKQNSKKQRKKPLGGVAGEVVKELAFVSEAKIAEKVTIERSPYGPPDDAVAQAQAKVITALRQRLKQQGRVVSLQPPVHFVFRFDHQADQIELSMIGAPPDGTTPQEMAVAIVRSLKWTEEP